MILLDTHAMIFDALTPERLGEAALAAIEAGAERGELACADISLWEIAMLIARGRLEIESEARPFIEDLLLARRIRILPITPEVAVLAQSKDFAHGDPADRLIAATALQQRCPLVTADRRLRDMPGVSSVW
jgi:PIN domain nuclease of toxin-antitoxin system